MEEVSQNTENEKDLKPSGRTDLISIVILNVFFFIQFFSMIAIVFTFLLEIVLCFFIAIFYAGKFSKYIAVIIIAFLMYCFLFGLIYILWNITLSSSLSSENAWIAVFCFITGITLLPSSLIGYLLAKKVKINPSVFLIFKTVNKKFKLAIVFLFFLILFLIAGFFIVVCIKENRVIVEAEKKEKLAKRIEVAIKNDKLVKFNNEELISMGLIQDLYNVDGDKIIHGFKGEFELNKKGDEVFLIYHDIPAGNYCRNFYQSSYNFWGRGFKRKNFNDLDQFCYSSKARVTMEFSGKLDEIKKAL